MARTGLEPWKLVPVKGSSSQPGPGCSKLKTLLVNVLLKFQTLISQICQYFLLKKCEKFCSAKASLILSTKNFSVFGYKVVKHLTSWPLNERVKLTMLWTTGPRVSFYFYKQNSRYSSAIYGDFAVRVFILLFSFSIFSDRWLLKIKNEYNSMKHKCRNWPLSLIYGS